MRERKNERKHFVVVNAAAAENVAGKGSPTNALLIGQHISVEAAKNTGQWAISR